MRVRKGYDRVLQHGRARMALLRGMHRNIFDSTGEGCLLRLDSAEHDSATGDIRISVRSNLGRRSPPTGQTHGIFPFLLPNPELTATLNHSRSDRPGS